MAVARHGKRWRYDFIKNGVRHRKGGFRTKQDARQAESEARKNLNSINMDFMNLCESRLDDLKSRRTLNYYRENKALLVKLLLVWGEKKTITRDDVEQYLIQRKDESSSYSANKDLRMNRRLFNHAVERDWLYKNPTTGVKFFSVKRPVKYIPPKEDIAKILEVADPEVKLYLKVVIYTAGRIREINNLKWEDIAEDFLILRTRKAKNSDIKERKVPISKKLKNALKAIPRKGEYVFINPRTQTKYDYRRRLMKSLCKRAGVKPRFGFHALRHRHPMGR
jgi:integrase